MLKISFIYEVHVPLQQLKFMWSRLNYTIYQKDLTPFKISSKTYLEIAKDDFSNLKAVE